MYFLRAHEKKEGKKEGKREEGDVVKAREERSYMYIYIQAEAETKRTYIKGRGFLSIR